ncbi:DUF2235 domain-containing protein [Sulfitobacter sp. D35]|uniref:DUF2235 domain-containing protein n=1 Tax=Sulfitobacter sp. D35 TaxID=3083252 RepID=UPI00296EE3A5|nr:DUF2235 domain-containing protein [Sulfitobacter sp. D35]MDW4497025.1 DUF2235 domain-containing protein [Sulfitobacter sp. D35]
MKTIAILCDGTWNSPDMERDTHVYRLFEACHVEDSPDQVVRYFPGVGVAAGSGRMRTFIGRQAQKFGGGAFGWGLNRNIKEAYRALCEDYEPGDRVMIFGFSRGAYTARSLGGLIRKGGILENPTEDRIDEVFKLYRARGPENKPDAPEIWKARRRFSPKVATSQKDLEMRGDDSVLIDIAYMGIWDTVGALGIPTSVLGAAASFWNSRYKFHDTDLSSLVGSARHAVALDERRRFYEPSLWNNLDRKGDDPGLNKGDTSPDRPYQQAWFVGTHSIVGGSAQAFALSAIPLQWVWEGAERQGLKLAPGARIPDVDPDPLLEADEIDNSGWFYKVAPQLMAWRKGPTGRDAVHPTARQRIREYRDEGYRPGSLAELIEDIISEVVEEITGADEPDRRRA